MEEEGHAADQPTVVVLGANVQGEAVASLGVDGHQHVKGSDREPFDLFFPEYDLDKNEVCK